VIPVLVFVKLGAFLLAGVYRGLWHYARVEDIVTYAKGVALGSAASVLAAVFLFRFHNFSRLMFVVDGLLLMALVTASRLSLRLVRNRLPVTVPDARRVLIYGADEAGELLLRELRAHRSAQYLPVGFADDDPARQGQVLQGLPVLGGNGELTASCARLNVGEVLISSGISDARVEEIRAQCANADIVLKRASLEIQPLGGEVGSTEPVLAAREGLETREPQAAPAAPTPVSRWRRWLRRFLVLVFLVAAMVLVHPYVLRGVAAGLIVDDAPAAADTIVIIKTSGDSAMPLDEVAQLYRQGLAGQILLIEDRTSRLCRLGIAPDFDTTVKRELMARDVPETAFASLAVTVRGEKEPARCLGMWLEQNPDRHVTVFCDQLASRGVARVFRQVLDRDYPKRVHWHAVPDRRFDQTNWWRRRQGIIAVLSEYLALGSALISGEEELPPPWNPDEYEQNLRRQAEH
jgi:CoA-binding domain